jgi:hypothetical protein
MILRKFGNYLLIDAATYVAYYLSTEVRKKPVNQLTNKQTKKRKNVVLAVKFKAHILEVIGWHLGRNTGQYEFPQGFSSDSPRKR